MKFRSDRGPIAVVGCGFRMPGAHGDEFWQALIGGRNLVGSVAADRWAQEPYLHPGKSVSGTSCTFAAGSLGDVFGFDAAFFGISLREAAQMDPQQRLLLEMSWEAFENALIPPSSMRGARCAVFVGLSSLDHAYRYADDLGSIDSTSMTGNTASLAANRISYVFDLRGPSLAVDTACSSSLVALHQACQSIRHGESDAALAAGISLHLHPYPFIGFSKASMLSRSGRCAVFDEDADGYVRSEGGAVLLLKPLAQAVADGNRVLAVIAATGVNSDGAKHGLTVPSHSAQAALLRDVYERAGIPPAAIDYFEAHGTGTAVGDPIEARAIGEALGAERPRGRPLPVGSVKGHTGHLEAAAGMAGLVKSLYVLRHRRVPANLHLAKPSPHIDFAGLNLAPVTEPLSLEAGRRLIVGVSAFGFGGTNAHAVLTSYEAAVSQPSRPSVRAPLLLSARSAAALRESARSMGRLLRERPDLPEYDIAYSALFGRDIHPQRLLVSGEDRAAVAASLERFAETGAAPGAVTGRFRADASPPAFVYSGNGSQWTGMGVQLLEEDSLFRESLEEVDALLRPWTDRSLLAELRAREADSRLERTEIGQPALFAIQVGLTRMLERSGVRPLAVVGHSVGEVAAAWASGALTLESAVRVIHERSAHQALTRGQGGMTAVELGEDAIATLLGALTMQHELTVAAVNGPASVTVAGEAAALARLETALARRSVSFRRLALEYAFHSRAMDQIREGLLGSLADLSSRPATTPLYSSVTGSGVDGTTLLGPYWWRNVREPVRFADAIRALLGAGINTFVEIGPRPVLLGYLNEIGGEAERTLLALPSLTTTESGASRMRTLIEQLELSGALADSSRLFPVPGRLVELPHYPWQRERCTAPRTEESLGLLERHSVHPLLGYRLGDDPLQWENHLDTCRFPALADHAVAGTCVFPAAGFVEMALAAGAARRPGAARVLEDLEIVAPLVLERDHSSTVRLRLDPDGTFTIVSRERERSDGWRTHAVGRLAEDGALSRPAAPLVPASVPDVTQASHYALATSLGLEYGPAFRSVDRAWVGSGGLTGALVLPEGAAQTLPGALLHPSLLDGAFQLLIDLVRHELSGSAPSPGADVPCFLPVRIGRLELQRPGERAALVEARLADTRHRSRRSLLADFALYDEAGRAVALARGVRFRAASVPRGARPALRSIATRAVAMPRREGERAYPLPDASELAQLVERRLHTEAHRAARLRYAKEVEPLLDALCAAFAERALRTLGGGDTLEPQALLASGAVSADAAPLLARLAQMLAEDGVLEAAGEESWRWTGAAGEPHFPAPADIWMSLVRDYPEYAGATARIGSAGMRLAERLREGAGGEPRGQRPAESAGSSLWWLEGATREEAAAVYGALADLIDRLVSSQRPEARLRILRIAHVPPPEELARTLWPLTHRERCDLTVAAPSQEVLEEVRRRVPSLARLPGRVLDLDEPHPKSDPGGRFDVVILGEGFADAPDPALRLANVRRLLLDGGLLLSLEQPPSRGADLVFGLEKNWWRTAGAASAPPVSRWRTALAWSAVLTRAGFVDPRAVCEGEDSSSGPYLLIARARNAPAEIARPSEAHAHGTWLIAHDRTGHSASLAAALAAELEGSGQRVLSVVPGEEYGTRGSEVTLDPESAAHWTRLLAELEHTGARIDGWVHLAGLDLGSARLEPHARTALQRSRAEVLIAWAQACGASPVRPACFCVGAHAGLELLPPAALPEPGSARPDRLRDAVLWGVARVAMQELAELKVRWVDLLCPLAPGSCALALARELLHPDAEDEILLTASGRFVPRLDGRADYTQLPRPSAPVASRVSFQLDFPVAGPLRNLRWRRREAPTAALAPGEIEIDVRATGLNFRDVMYAMGLLPDEAVENGFCGPSLGIELAGVVVGAGAEVGEFALGEEVMAIAPGAFASRVRTPAWAATAKPAGWSLTAAATVPVAFFTAYYALVELARLRAGERLLIHGAAGGVGIAAVQIARHLGAEVFATAGSALKRDFVTLLGADCVFDSRSLGFADEILEATGGEGVDVVLNSLAGEAMRRTVSLLKPFGRMLELGKRDFYENSRLSLRPFRNNIAYFGIDAEQLLAERPDTVRRCFAALREMFASGVLHPLPHQSFCAADVEAAFRHMRSSRHIGKIVVTYPADFDPLGAEATPLGEVAQPPAPPPVLRPDATYLVTGGLSGFGLRTAEWLTERGARHLALLGRRGAATPEAEAALARFANAGIEVRAIACDVADAAALRGALAELDASLPPLRGVVHAAAIIEDALIRDLGCGQLERVLAPKVSGALALHEATLGRELDFFVLYSSATTLFGNPGQAAYVAANMALEALAAERRALGLPATCVGFGPIGDAGYLARNDKVREALAGRIGGRPLAAGEALGALGSLLTAPTPTVGVLDFDWSVLRRSLPASGAPKFSELARADERGSAAGEEPQDLRAWLEALPQGELVPALAGLVRIEIAQILRTTPERLDPAVSLFEAGMDSLMAVELATSLEVRLGVQLSALSFSDGPTIERIAARIARQVRPADAPDEPEPAAGGALAEQVRFVAAQHASEVSEGAARELSEELGGREAAPLSGAGGDR